MPGSTPMTGTSTSARICLMASAVAVLQATTMASHPASAKYWQRLKLRAEIHSLDFSPYGAFTESAK